jgi:hypothetical protein
VSGRCLPASTVPVPVRPRPYRDGLLRGQGRIAGASAAPPSLGTSISPSRRGRPPLPPRAPNATFGASGAPNATLWAFTPRSGPDRPASSGREGRKRRRTKVKVRAGRAGTVPGPDGSGDRPAGGNARRTGSPAGAARRSSDMAGPAGCGTPRMSPESKHLAGNSCARRRHGRRTGAAALRSSRVVGMGAVRIGGRSGSPHHAIPRPFNEVRRRDIRVSGAGKRASSASRASRNSGRSRPRTEAAAPIERTPPCPAHVGRLIHSTSARSVPSRPPCREWAARPVPARPRGVPGTPRRAVPCRLRLRHLFP